MLCLNAVLKLHHEAVDTLAAVMINGIEKEADDIYNTIHVVLVFIIIIIIIIMIIIIMALVRIFLEVWNQTV